MGDQSEQKENVKAQGLRLIQRQRAGLNPSPIARQGLVPAVRQRANPTRHTSESQAYGFGLRDESTSSTLAGKWICIQAILRSLRRRGVNS